MERACNSIALTSTRCSREYLWDLWKGYHWGCWATTDCYFNLGHCDWIHSTVLHHQHSSLLPIAHIHQTRESLPPIQPDSFLASPVALFSPAWKSRSQGALLCAGSAKCLENRGKYYIPKSDDCDWILASYRDWKPMQPCWGQSIAKNQDYDVSPKKVYKRPSRWQWQCNLEGSWLVFTQYIDVILQHCFGSNELGISIQSVKLKEAQQGSEQFSFLLGISCAVSQFNLRLKQIWRAPQLFTIMPLLEAQGNIPARVTFKARLIARGTKLSSYDIQITFPLWVALEFSPEVAAKIVMQSAGWGSCESFK